MKYLKLPEYVEPCWCCKGEGEYSQRYTAGCGGGYYNSTGPCDYCKPKDNRHHWKGIGYVYKHNNEAVPESVMIQIKRMNPVPKGEE